MKKLPVALIAVTAVTWLLVVAMTASSYGEFLDRSDRANSAPQVSQVADEFLAGTALTFVIGVGVTSLCAVVALTMNARRNDSTPAND